MEREGGRERGREGEGNKSDPSGDYVSRDVEVLSRGAVTHRRTAV